jgi:hypothetical protein
VADPQLWRLEVTSRGQLHAVSRAVVGKWSVHSAPARKGNEHARQDHHHARWGRYAPRESSERGRGWHPPAAPRVVGVPPGAPSPTNLTPLRTCLQRGRRPRGGATTRIRILLVAVVAGVMLAMPTAAAARVRLVSVTSPIGPGYYARLTAAVSPLRTCSIVVNYLSGPSHAAGLYPKRPVNGRVSWTWKVGTRTTPGRWPITVSCGSAGTLHTSFVVR